MMRQVLGGGDRPATIPPFVVRQNRLHMTVEALRGGEENMDKGDVGVATEELRTLGPKMLMPPALK